MCIHTPLVKVGHKANPKPRWKEVHFSHGSVVSSSEYCRVINYHKLDLDEPKSCSRDQWEKRVFQRKELHQEKLGDTRMCGTCRELWVVGRTEAQGALWEMLNVFRKLNQERETRACISGLEENQKIWTDWGKVRGLPSLLDFLGTLALFLEISTSWGRKKTFHQPSVLSRQPIFTFSSPSKGRIALPQYLPCPRNI